MATGPHQPSIRRALPGRQPVLLCGPQARPPRLSGSFAASCFSTRKRGQRSLAGLRSGTGSRKVSGLIVFLVARIRQPAAALAAKGFSWAATFLRADKMLGELALRLGTLPSVANHLSALKTIASSAPL